MGSVEDRMHDTVALMYMMIGRREDGIDKSDEKEFLRRLKRETTVYAELKSQLK